MAELVIRDRRALTGERDPRGATRALGWTAPGLAQVDQWNAEQAFRLGYYANVIAYRCVQLRANAVSSVPIVAGSRLGDPKTINPNAAIAKLLGPPPGGPAPKLSASKLIRWTIAQEIVTGRRAWEIETNDRGQPVAFWPLVASQLRAVPSEGGTDWFRVFEYGRTDRPTRFTPDQVFFGWDPSGTDFRQAESGLQASRYDLSLITLCDRYGISFLRNNAVPAAVITTTRFPDEELRRAFEQQWAAEFEGVDNAGRVGFNYVNDEGDGPVGDSIDVKVLGLSAKDARLIETRKEAMIEVAISLGTPWSKLDASGRTFDNADAEDRTYWEETVLPDLQDLQDDINMQLAPRLGSDVVWFDLREVRALRRKIQPVTQTVGAPALVQSMIMTLDEARADYGLEPLPDGMGARLLTAREIAMLSVNAAPILLADLLPTPEPSPAIPPASTGPDADDPGLNADDPANRTRRGENRAPDPDQLEQRRALIWRQTDAAVATLEARWVRAWRRMFTRQRDATLARLTGKRGRQALGYGADGQLEQRADPSPLIDPGAIFTVEFWRDEAAAIAADLFEEVVTASTQRLAARFGIAFDLTVAWVEEFIRARANMLAGHVTQTTYDQITEQLAEGVREGESIDDLATRVRGVFTQADEQRAVTIARTEVISAYNGAATQGAATLPADVVAGQEWIATRDGRTRSAHAAADGQIVAVGSPFTVGGATLAYPGDPAGGPRNTVNCRCAVAFLDPEEFAELTDRTAKRMPLRAAAALLALVPTGGDGFDFISWRRAAEEVAA